MPASEESPLPNESFAPPDFRVEVWCDSCNALDAFDQIQKFSQTR